MNDRFLRFGLGSKLALLSLLLIVTNNVYAEDYSCSPIWAQVQGTTYTRQSGPLHSIWCYVGSAQPLCGIRCQPVYVETIFESEDPGSDCWINYECHTVTVNGLEK